MTTVVGSKDLITKPISAKNIKKEWVLVDVSDKYVGRVASQIANILRGKNKPYFTPFLDCGDNVVVINCSKLLFSGNKMEEKSYLRHTGYPGGQRWTYVKDLIKNDARKIMMHAVKGMLPKNKLGRKLLKNIRLYNGSEHDLTAQKPKKIELI